MHSPQKYKSITIHVDMSECDTVLLGNICVKIINKYNISKVRYTRLHNDEHFISKQEKFIRTSLPLEIKLKVVV